MHRSIVVLLLIFLLIALAILAPMLPRFGDVLIYPANAQFTDLTITHWPAFAYTRDHLQAAGQIPLWRSSILSGTPFAADPLSGLFYPPHWIAFIPAVPLSLAFNLLMLLHLALAAGAMYFLMQRWSVGRAAALIAAFAFAASPKIIAHMGVGHVTLVEAWTWVPLVIAGAVPSLRTGKPNVLLSASALGLCVLADARMAVYAVVSLVLYVLIVRTSQTRRAWIKALGLLLVVAIVALALSAAAWLPALTLTDGSARANLSEQEAGTLSLDAAYVLGTLIADRSGVAERTTYFGLVVLILALVGMNLQWHTQRRMMIWFVVVISVGVIAALGTSTPLYSLLYRLPGSTLFRVPARTWFMVAFAMAALAGFGAQGLIEWTGRPKPRSILLGTSVCLFAILFGVIGGLLTKSISLWLLAIFVPLTVLLIVLRLQKRLTPDRFTAAIAALLIVDLLTIAWALYRPIGLAEAFADGHQPAAWLAAQPGQFRAYSPSYSVPQHVAQQFQLQLADGIDPLQLRRYVMFMQHATGIGEWGYSVTLPPFPGVKKDEDIRSVLKDVQPNAALLGLLNVKHVDAAFPIDQSDLVARERFGFTTIYENRRVLPRAYLVSKIDVADSPEAAGVWLEAHDVATSAVVEGLPYPIELAVKPGEVEIVSWAPDHIELKVAGPGWLVLSEIVAPDWTATVDGEPASIFPTDLALRGLYVPWGEHAITFDYQPRRVYAGVLISVLSVAVVGGALVLKRWVKRDV
jgi:Bacterial membrane protein YfhO